MHTAIKKNFLKIDKFRHISPYNIFLNIFRIFFSPYQSFLYEEAERSRVAEDGLACGWRMQMRTAKKPSHWRCCCCSSGLMNISRRAHLHWLVSPPSVRLNAGESENRFSAGFLNLPRPRARAAVVLAACALWDASGPSTVLGYTYSNFVNGYCAGKGILIWKYFLLL